MKPPNENPNASCSDDLDRAKQLSRALTGAEAKGAAAQAGTGYVTFAPRGASRPTPVPRAAPPPPVVAARPSTPVMIRREFVAAPIVGFGAAAWQSFLDGCLSSAHAESAFVMDAHGLIVVSRGQNTEGLEATGSRLLLAFDHADRTSGERVLSMSVESARGTLHGLRLMQSDASFLLLGLVVPGGLSAERQQRLHALVNEASRVAQPPP
jgi:hypothetical protein